jgi:hypothetical protein
MTAQTSAAHPPERADDRCGAGFAVVGIERGMRFRFAAFRILSQVRRSSPIWVDRNMSARKRRISWSQRGFQAPEIRYDARSRLAKSRLGPILLQT